MCESKLYLRLTALHNITICYNLQIVMLCSAVNLKYNLRLTALHNITICYNLQIAYNILTHI